MPDNPAFTFDRAARRFRAASGRFLPATAVRAGIDAMARGAGAEMRAVAEKLQAGEINAAEFSIRMRALIKASQVAAGGIALGGKAGLDARGMAEIANAIKAQYAYLYGLTREIEAGLPLDGRFLARAAMYGQSSRATYENIGRARDVEAGYDEERRVLHGPNPCRGCIAEAAKGWRPTGELLPIGSCECLSGCRCGWIRRKSAPPTTNPATPPTAVGGSFAGLAFALSPQQSARRSRIAMADVSKLDASLRSDQGGFYVGKGGVGPSAVKGRYAAARAFLEESAADGTPVHPTDVSLGPDGQAYIDDGRHRFAALRDAGVKAVPVAVSAGQVKAFGKLYGAKGDAAMGDETASGNPDDLATFKGGGKSGGKSGKGPSGGHGKLSGGHWVTIHGHPAYVKSGKVVAGGLKGHTHDAKGKPSGAMDRLGEADGKLARAHVVKGMKADRIRGNAPGKDASGVDHARLGESIRRTGGSYSHGAPKSPADRKHLAEAERQGGTAVKVTKTAKVWTDRGRGLTQYHAGAQLGIAHVHHRKNDDGRYEVRSQSGVSEHRTLKGAHKAARKEAGEHARNITRESTRRLVVKGGDPARRADAIDAEVPAADRVHGVKAHVLHRGRGSKATFSGGGLATFKGGGAKAAPRPSAKATKSTPGHSSPGKPGGCGTGAGGFKAGNTCGHKGNRNQKVEEARAAHHAAKAEVLAHVKAHRKATRAAAKTGEAVAHPKELHAALKKSAAAHRALQDARATHRDNKRAERNAAARERRAVKAGKASPIGAKPVKPTRTGQAKPPSTDKGSPADRLGVAAARHRRVAGTLSKRADDLKRQADQLSGGTRDGRVAPPSGGSRGRGLGGAPVSAGGVHEVSRDARQLDSAAGKLAARARHHGTRAMALERAAAKAKRAANGPSPDAFALRPAPAVRGNGGDAFRDTGKGHGGRMPLLGLQDLPTNSARGQGSLFGPRIHDANAGVSGTTGRGVVVGRDGQHRLPGDFGPRSLRDQADASRSGKGSREDRIRRNLARNNAIRESVGERSVAAVRARDDAMKALRDLHESNPINPDPRTHSDRVANERALKERARKIRAAYDAVRKAEAAMAPIRLRSDRSAARGDRLVRAIQAAYQRGGAGFSEAELDRIADEVSASLATFRTAGGMRPAAKSATAKTGKVPAGGHAATGKPGGCGTGAGGFKPGNTCGHTGQRNATVEAARAAHRDAKAELAGHLKSHRKAARAAGKAGTPAPAPKELHAAVRKTAAAHAALREARATHHAEKRAERNAAARERRAAARAEKPGSPATPAWPAPKVRPAVTVGKAAPRSVAHAPAKASRDPSSHDDHAPGHVGMLDTKLIHADPRRFQYKEALNEAGSVGSLAGVKKYDHNLGGVVQVWKDPADNKTYVVNGHNRLELANKLGADKITVRYLDAKDHREARSIGALTNIAEGRGTAVDAAKYFRDTGLTREQIADKGIPLREKVATDGIALSHLDRGVFDKVTSGQLTPERGAIIGAANLDHHEQRALVAMLDKHKGREITNSHLKELADEVKSARSVRQKTTDLFGSHEDDHSLALHKTKLQATIKERLGKEKRLFGIVAKSKHAEDLSRAGNQINTHESAKVADNAATTLGVFDSLKNLRGPVSKTLNDAAERIHRGENAKKVTDETYRSILKDLPAMLHGNNAFAP